MVERTLLVNIAGGHCIKLHATARQIKARLQISYPDAEISIIDLDKSYQRRNEANLKDYSYKDYDFESLYNKLYRLKNVVVPFNGTSVCQSGQNTSNSQHISVVILCGCYALYDKRINNLCNLKIYIDSDSDKRLINLIKEKKCLEGHDLNVLLTEYMDHLRIEMDRYIQPTRASADLIIPTTDEKLGEEILVSGISHLIKFNDSVTNGSEGKNNCSSMLQKSTSQQPLWDFQGEFMDVEKSRYYDLS